MFKNYTSCEKCIHNSVCVYKLELKEICNKIGGKWDNIAPSDIFKLELKCTEFKEDMAIRNNGGLFT